MPIPSPTLQPMLSMATGAVVWPIVSRRMQNKKIATSEQERKDGYTLYLDAARARIETFGIEQLEALENNYEEIDCVLERLSRHDTNLMNHISTHDDFMCVRMGKGTIDNQYVSLFGTMRGAPVPRGFGRGIIKRDNQIYEFQSCFVQTKEEDTFDGIMRATKALADKYGQCDDRVTNCGVKTVS